MKLFKSIMLIALIIGAITAMLIVKTAKNTSVEYVRTEIDNAEEKTSTIIMAETIDEAQIEKEETEPIQAPEIVEDIIAEKVWSPLNTEACTYIREQSVFYMDPQTAVLGVESDARRRGDTETADLLLEISCYPQATWLTWQDAEFMKLRVSEIAIGAAKNSQIPVFVIYNSPSYDSTHWWVGNQGQDYFDWVKAVAEGVGDTEAWFIIEPDALGLATDYSEEDRDYRLNELSRVVSIIKTNAPNARVYLDAGHSKWKTSIYFAELLKTAGIEKADGFVLNISNYQLLEDEIARGNAISSLTGGKHFIVDTSRNGNGAPEDNKWCNTRERALGRHPTTDTNNSLIDAFLWIKPPGESDGTCNGGPTPGKFWLEYALELIKNAK